MFFCIHLVQFLHLSIAKVIFPRDWNSIRSSHRVCIVYNTSGFVACLTLLTGNLMIFHRADFQQVLLGHLISSCKTHCGKRLRTYTQRASEPIKLLFEDGTTATCDVLVGADGLKSAVRQTLMTEKAHLAQSEGRRAEAADCLASIDPLWSGTNSYRALIPVDRLRVECPSHRVLVQPIQVCVSTNFSG